MNRANNFYNNNNNREIYHYRYERSDSSRRKKSIGEKKNEIYNLQKKLNYNYNNDYFLKRKNMFPGYYHPEINRNIHNIHNIHNSNNYSTYYPFKNKQGLYGYPLGLFKENDWNCVNCNNINFSWRNECNRCHLEKYKNDIYQEGKYKFLKKRQHSRSSEHFSSSKKSSFSSKNKSYSYSKSYSNKSNYSYSDIKQEKRDKKEKYKMSDMENFKI